MTVAELETRVSTLERNVDKVIAKLDMFIEESREARKRHDADMREFREKHDADMREMRQVVDNMGNHVRNISIVTMIGIAAMVVAVSLK